MSKKLEKQSVPSEEEGDDIVGGNKEVAFVPVGIAARNAVCGGIHPSVELGNQGSGLWGVIYPKQGGNCAFVSHEWHT